MATTVRRKKAVAFDPDQTFSEHILLKHQVTPTVLRVEKLKKRLKDWFEKEAGDVVYTNEQGSQFYDLETPVHVGETVYTGMEHRRSVTPQFLEEEAEKILTRKGLLDEATSTETYIDQDKIARLQQEGKISEKEIDKMFGEKISWAFWPVKED